MSKPRRIIVAINPGKATDLIVRTLHQDVEVIRIINCRTVDDLKRLRPQPAHWERLQFVVSSGAITPEQFAVWINLVKPQGDARTLINTIEPLEGRRGPKAKSVNGDFVARFEAALERLRQQGQQSQQQGRQPRMRRR